MASSRAEIEKRETLLRALRALADGLDTKVDESRKYYKSCGGINDFLTGNGLKMIFPVGLYVECFKTVGVRCRSEVEALWTSLYSDPTVSECVENLLAAEDHWTGFIAELDREMEAHEEQAALPIVHVEERFPLDISLVETRSGDTVQLKNCLEKSKFTMFILRKHYV